MKGIFEFRRGPASVLARWAFHAGALCKWSYHEKPDQDTRWLQTVGWKDAAYYTSPIPLVPAWIMGNDGGGYQVAIAGTNQVRQWLAYILQFGMANASTLSGQVFAPFNDWSNTIAANIADVVPNGVRITITGHSLGGAMAILVGEKLRVRGKRVQLACTFGCPRIGDEDFASAVQTTTYNVRRLADLVPDVPPRAYTRRTIGIVSVPTIPALYRPGFEYVLPADWSLVQNASALVPDVSPLSFIENINDAATQRHIIDNYLVQLWAQITPEDRAANRDLFVLLTQVYNIQLTPAP